MTVLIVESLFKNHIKVHNIINIIDKYFKEIPIISITEPNKILKKEELNAYCKKVKKLDFSFDFFNGLKNCILVIEILNKEDILAKYLTIPNDIIFVSNKKLENINYDIESNGEYLRIVTDYENFDELHNKLKLVIKKREKAKELMKIASFDKASNIYKEIADFLYKIGLYNIARDYYAYAAITAERTEKWRRISYLWYSAYEPIVDNQDYKDYNTMLHTFPSISFEKWNSFSSKEKQGRALQYAAYSDDNHNGTLDSYWIYEKAAKKYLEADQYGRAIECAALATSRYAIHFHGVKHEMIELWIKLLSNPQKQNYDDLLYISFNNIYRNLNLYKSESASFFYIEMQKIKQKKLLFEKKYFRYAIDWLLSKITNYGTSISKIIGGALALVLLGFPMIFFCLCEGIGILNAGFSTEIIIKYIRYVGISFNVFLGVGTVPDIPGLFHVIVIFEAFYSYIVLILISTNIIGRLINPNL